MILGLISCSHLNSIMVTQVVLVHLHNILIATVVYVIIAVQQANTLVIIMIQPIVHALLLQEVRFQQDKPDVTLPAITAMLAVDVIGVVTLTVHLEQDVLVHGVLQHIYQNVRHQGAVQLILSILQAV